MTRAKFPAMSFLSLALVLASAGGQSRAQTAGAAFDPVERSVSNWRSEAATNLDLDEDSAAALIGGAEPKGVGRCVRLNNYWCIKGAGWNGMIAADSEGHAAFSSALEGATVAALLLRRYYLEFDRKSATAIVSRWAPPQCGGPVSTARIGATGRLGLLHRAPNLGPDPGFAAHGLGATLRARYLAARRSGRRAALPRSRVSDTPVSLIRAPTIAEGFGEVKIALPTLKLAALASPASAGAMIPFAGCSLDGPRLRNYAQRAIEGAADSADADLKLFEPDGEPAAALQRVLENMSSVEIGPMKADPNLVRDAIAAATAAMRAARANAAAPSTTTSEAAPDLRPSTPADTPAPADWASALRGAAPADETH